MNATEQDQNKKVNYNLLRNRLTLRIVLLCQILNYKQYSAKSIFLSHLHLYQQYKSWP